MKVGVFAYDFNPIKGGAGVHVNEIYSKRLARKEKVTIFSPPPNSLYRNPLGFFIFSILSSYKINKIQESHKFDVINWHVGPNGFFLLNKPKDCMCVPTAHHTYWQQATYIPSQVWKKIFIPFEKITYSLADKIIAVSEDTKNVLHQHYKIPLEKIIVIPNGVDFSKFKKLKRIKKIPKSLLFVGRLDKRKGIDFLVRSLYKTKERIPNIKLYIIGQGKLKKKLELFIKRKDLERNIFFLDRVSNKELIHWYNKCEVTIVPSIFEGFGIVVLESLACGTPVIGTNSPGIRNIITDKEFLIEYNNSNELTEKLISFFNFPQTKPSFKRSSWEIKNVVKKTHRALANE